MTREEKRIGGIAVFDITDPRDAEAFMAGDLGPEGIEFIPAILSPTFKPMLAVGNEISGTTTLYEIELTR